MLRRISVMLLIIIIAISVGYYAHSKGIIDTALPFIEPETEETMSVIVIPQTTIEVPTISDTTYDFISFADEHVLDIAPILQMPDFPTGCESVSLTMALNYITEEEIPPEIIIDDYLPRSDTSNFAEGFVGDPRSKEGGGCYPPAILRAANTFLADNHIRMFAFDATGINIELLKHYLDNGFPVLMWTTMYMGQPQHNSWSCEYDGKTYNWYTSEHCVLVKGYDLEKNVLIINDPLIGEVERDIDDFMKISDEIGNLAVIIL